MYIGRVKTVKNKGEYGFVELDGSPDGLFHHWNGKVALLAGSNATMVDLRHATLNEGDIIVFEKREDGAKWTASPWIAFSHSAQIRLARTNEHGDK